MIYFPFFLCLGLGLFLLVSAYAIFEHSKNVGPGNTRENYDALIDCAVVGGVVMWGICVVYWVQVIIPILKAGG